jgi:protein phosphatase 2C family protein 2/3
MVMASDGLWDVLNGVEAAATVRRAFVALKSPTAAAEELCQLALKLGSSDNVTVIIVQFSHTARS